MSIGWVVGWAGVAQSAEPARAAVSVTPAWSAADLRAQVAGRVRFGGTQLGAEVRWAEVHKAWIDGWPVTSGTARSALGHAAVPLIEGRRVRVDLRGNAGIRWLTARETDAPQDTSVALLTEIGPRVTLGLGDRAAVVVGFDNLVDFQLDPSFATDGLGQLLEGFPDGVRSLEITLVVEEGALDLFVDGQRLDPLDAVVTGNRYVWTIPNSSNPALQFVTENRIEGLTVYEVFVAGSSDRL